MKRLLKKEYRILLAIIAIVPLISVGIFSKTFAAAMSSGSYSIQADSINVGGIQSDSASYGLEDTAGEVATGDSESASFKLKAGYQQMTGSYIAIASVSDVVMSPTIGGVGGGTSNGSGATTVTTDNAAGYSLYIKASSTPAMQGDSNGDTIANYTRTLSDPDFTFSVGASAAEFGFTPEGTDVAPEYLDNGIDTCATGSSETANSCWSAITTTDELIATRSSANHPSGTATTVKFRLTVGASTIKAVGNYTATTTLTAIAL